MFLLMIFEKIVVQIYLMDFYLNKLFLTFIYILLNFHFKQILCSVSDNGKFMQIYV